MSHPSACLLSWFIAILALQYLEWPALLGLAAVISLAGTGTRRRWLTLVRRARWLLLTLWLILAYGTPGDAWNDWPWAPTDAGVHDASIHAARLVLMLGALAWLFEALSRERMMAGLWFLVRPLRGLGVDTDRVVVRLALVFDYLEKSPARGSWRRLLDEPPLGADGPASIRIDLPRWLPMDTGLVLGVAVLMVLAVWLP